MDWKTQAAATNIKLLSYHSTYIEPRKRDVFLYSRKAKWFDYYCVVIMSWLGWKERGNLSWALSLEIQSWEKPCVLAGVSEMLLWENVEQQM